MPPAGAGVLVAAFGGPRTLWCAAALLATAALLTAMVPAGVGAGADPAAGPATASYLARLREGAAFLRREPLLRAITAMVVVTNLLDQAFMAVLLPVWVRAVGRGPTTVGLLVSVFAATSVVAALAAASVGDRLPRRPVYLIGYVVGGVPRFAALALGLPLWAVLAIFAIGGLGSGFVNPIIGAVTIERVPVRLLGRLRTLITALSWSGMPFGGVLAAWLLAATGLTGTLYLVGAGYLAAIVLSGMRPEWTGLRRPRLQADIAGSRQLPGGPRSPRGAAPRPG